MSAQVNQTHHTQSVERKETMQPTSSITEDVTYCPATSLTSDGVQSLDSNKTVELHTYSLMGDNLDTTIKR